VVTGGSAVATGIDGLAADGLLDVGAVPLDTVADAATVAEVTVEPAADVADDVKGDEVPDGVAVPVAVLLPDVAAVLEAAPGVDAAAVVVDEAEAVDGAGDEVEADAEPPAAPDDCAGTDSDGEAAVAPDEPGDAEPDAGSPRPEDAGIPLAPADALVAAASTAPVRASLAMDAIWLGKVDCVKAGSRSG
jgi:hypothetical protein